MSLLYLISASAIPEFEDEPEFLLVDTGFEHLGDDDEIPNDQLAYVSTLVSNFSDPGELEDLVKRWWKALSEVEPELQIVASQIVQMSPDQIASLESLEPESWSVRNVFMAYRADSPEATQEAHQFVLDSATVST